MTTDEESRIRSSKDQQEWQENINRLAGMVAVMGNLNFMLSAPLVCAEIHVRFATDPSREHFLEMMGRAFDAVSLLGQALESDSLGAKLH